MKPRAPADIMDLVCDADAAWFAAHPDRSTRVRLFVDGEVPGSMPSGHGVACTIVRQIHPGVRARIPAYLSRMPPDSEAAALQALQQQRGGA